jgi:hypothetical protein
VGRGRGPPHRHPPRRAAAPPPLRPPSPWRTPPGGAPAPATATARPRTPHQICPAGPWPSRARPPAPVSQVRDGSTLFCSSGRGGSSRRCCCNGAARLRRRRRRGCRRAADAAAGAAHGARRCCAPHAPSPPRLPPQQPRPLRHGARPIQQPWCAGPRLAAACLAAARRRAPLPASPPRAAARRCAPPLRPLRPPPLSARTATLPAAWHRRQGATPRRKTLATRARPPPPDLEAPRARRAAVKASHRRPVATDTARSG